MAKKDLQKEVTIEKEQVEETVDVSQEVKEDIKEKKELTLEETLSELQKERMGYFKIQLSKTDATYLRNILDKAEFVGPQQAYLLLISRAELSSIADMLDEKQKRVEVSISSAAVESLNFFMNKKTGTGEQSANKLFAASMLLRPAIENINNIDKKIAEIRDKISKDDKK